MVYENKTEGWFNGGLQVETESAKSKSIQDL